MTNDCEVKELNLVRHRLDLDVLDSKGLALVPSVGEKRKDLGCSSLRNHTNGNEEVPKVGGKDPLGLVVGVERVGPIEVVGKREGSERLSEEEG